jgi:hypothetical protein
MTLNEPFLTGFSSHLFGSAKRSNQAIFQRKIEQFGYTTISGLSILFEPVLPSAKLSEWCQSERKRTYDSTTTFWAWCSQILEANASCHHPSKNSRTLRENAADATALLQYDLHADPRGTARSYH